MGDHITNELAPGSPDIHASNGLLATFFDVLTLAATARARTTWELQLALWLAESDQTVMGLGMVGFDVSELGWTAEAFDAQKRFLLEVIDAALAREGWERLPFELDAAPWVVTLLGKVREMVERLPAKASRRPTSSRGAGMKGSRSMGFVSCITSTCTPPDVSSVTRLHWTYPCLTARSPRRAFSSPRAFQLGHGLAPDWPHQARNILGLHAFSPRLHESSCLLRDWFNPCAHSR